jgi:hypothetical protein
LPHYLLGTPIACSRDAPANASTNGVPQDLHLTPRDEVLIRRCMVDFGYSRERRSGG